MPTLPIRSALRWDIFCCVIDNHGDLGVCWRLACELARRGQAVRLVVDDARALAWMAPQGHFGVQVLPWPGPAGAAEVVVEAFGCDPPAAYVQAMAVKPRPPVWINVEYLSAEAYVERSHGLRSPQPGGLDKWFFYPGFTARTGGLLREAGLIETRAAFNRDSWLQDLGLQVAAGEQVVSLFCYENLALPMLLADLARRPTLLLLAPGPAQRQVERVPPGVRVVRLPWLSQVGFDHLLWASDLNFVRGEDSLVRAVWAGAPFVWQAYPQHDGVHHAKVEAMLAQCSLPAEAEAVWRAWNGAGRVPWPGLPAGAAWGGATLRWRQALQMQPDLASQLLDFVAAKGAAAG